MKRISDIGVVAQDSFGNWITYETVSCINPDHLEEVLQSENIRASLIIIAQVVTVVTLTESKVVVHSRWIKTPQLFKSNYKY